MIPAYVTAVIFFGTAIMDIATLAMPFNPAASVWRFGTVGAASNYLMTAFFGVVVACWTAMYYGHRGALRVIAAFSLVAALVLVFVIADFALNVARLRGGVPAAEQSAFAIGTMKATIKYAMAVVGFVALGLAGWKSARQ